MPGFQVLHIAVIRSDQDQSLFLLPCLQQAAKHCVEIFQQANAARHVLVMAHEIADPEIEEGQVILRRHRGQPAACSGRLHQRRILIAQLLPPAMAGEIH